VSDTIKRSGLIRCCICGRSSAAYVGGYCPTHAPSTGLRRGMTPNERWLLTKDHLENLLIDLGIKTPEHDALLSKHASAIVVSTSADSGAS
jgi:hypothetical protein